MSSVSGVSVGELSGEVLPFVYRDSPRHLVLRVFPGSSPVAAQHVQLGTREDMLDKYRQIDTVLAYSLRWSSIGTLTAIFILMIGSVLVRFIPVMSFGWFDAIIELRGSVDPIPH